MNNFEQLSTQLLRRARLLQGLRFSSGVLLLSLGATALGMLAALLLNRSLPMWTWLGLNALSAVGGFLWGWLRPPHLSQLLYQVDRRLAWGERLITIFELKPQKSEFLPLLEARLERALTHHPATLNEALPLERSTQRCWRGVLALGLICFALASQPSFLLWPPAPTSPTAKQKTEVPPPSPSTADLLQPPPPALSGKIPTWREKLEQARTALNQKPDDPRARAALEQLQAEITEAQNLLLPAPPSGQTPQEPPAPESKSPQNAELTNEPSGLPGGPQGSSRNDKLDKLDRLMHDLRAIHGQAQALSLAEMQKLLDELRAQNPEAHSLGAAGSAQNPEEFSRQLEEALKNLETRQTLQQQLQALQKEIQSALSPPNENQPSSPGSSTSAPSPTPPAGETAGPRDPNSTSQPAGGQGTAPLDPQAERDLPDLSGLREEIKSISVPGSNEENLQLLFEVFQSGLPQEKTVAGARAAVSIDYQKVETLLDALAIPAELRDTVRKYFLSLAQPAK